MKHDGAHIVVGGGLNGLLLAEHLRGRFAEVILIETEASCGGLLRSFDYGEAGQFDYGTHILSETGEPALDAYLTGLLPEEEWTFLRGARRDIAGLYFRGRLQLHSSYPDLSGLGPEVRAACVADFLDHLSEDDGADASNAEEYLVRRFGPRIAREVGAPMVERFARVKASEAALLAVRLVPLNRMALFPAHLCRDLVDTRLIGPRLAYVDQRDIPQRERSALAAFYPRRRGLQRVIDALVRRSSERGVRILCGSRIRRIAPQPDGLSLELEGAAPMKARHLYWTANPLGLAAALGVGVRWDEMDRPLTTVLCHYLVRARPALDDLYYAYCGDAGFHSFRVTNYAAYCPEPSGAFPLTVELLLSEAELAAERERLETLGYAELSRMGMVASEPALFARAEVLKYGFTRPSLRNAREMRRVRDAILEAAGPQVSLLGIGSREGLFFMKDVLRETFAFARARSS